MKNTRKTSTLPHRRPFSTAENPGEKMKPKMTHSSDKQGKLKSNKSGQSSGFLLK